MLHIYIYIYIYIYDISSLRVNEKLLQLLISSNTGPGKWSQTFNITSCQVSLVWTVVWYCETSNLDSPIVTVMPSFSMTDVYYGVKNQNDTLLSLTIYYTVRCMKSYHLTTEKHSLWKTASWGKGSMITDLYTQSFFVSWIMVRPLYCKHHTWSPREMHKHTNYMPLWK